MHQLVLLAKLAVENYIKEGKVIEMPKDLPEEFLKRMAGTFVTIETSEPIRQAQGKLRGCIGTYLPTKENVAEEIIHNAIAVATEDYRFGPIQKEELPYLSYTVYILSQPELVKDIKELNPKNFGIIVKTAEMPFKSGLLLPDLEGVDTIEQQISIACQKGGIEPATEKIIIYKFTVEKFE